MNEKLKLIISASVTGALFIAALLLPLAFRGGENVRAGSLSRGERSAMFGEYWSGGESDITVEKIDKPSTGSINYCAEFMDKLVQECTIDKNVASSEEKGSEYIILSDGKREMRVCRMWLQYQGDWRSWLDVCFDMDTGYIYNLYVSSECIFNGGDYAGAIEPAPDTETVAGVVAERLGYELLDLNWDGDAASTATVVYGSGGSAVCCEISCIYYEATLLDIRICCI